MNNLTEDKIYRLTKTDLKYIVGFERVESYEETLYYVTFHKRLKVKKTGLQSLIISWDGMTHEYRAIRKRISEKDFNEILMPTLRRLDE